jgi:hypothetical protein
MEVCKAISSNILCTVLEHILIYTICTFIPQLHENIWRKTVTLALHGLQFISMLRFAVSHILLSIENFSTYHTCSITRKEQKTPCAVCAYPFTELRVV